MWLNRFTEKCEQCDNLIAVTTTGKRYLRYIKNESINTYKKYNYEIAYYSVRCKCDIKTIDNYVRLYRACG